MSFDINQCGMRWLVSSWDSRDPSCDLKDIECGRYLAALDQLPNSMRQLLEDNSMYCELEEIEGRYYISKIIKKREPEYIQGTDHYFIFDKYGKRVRVTEEQYESLLGMKHNPEDVFNGEHIEIESLDTFQSTPRDIWDVIYDASSYIRTVRMLTENSEWQESHSSEEKMQIFQDLADGCCEGFQDTSIYSADYFPYSKHKNAKTKNVRELTQLIEKGITKGELGKRVYARPDARPSLVKELKAQAEKMAPGTERVKIFKKAEAVKQSYLKAQQTAKPVLSQAEVTKVWEIWAEHELKVNGKVKLPDWKIKKNQDQADMAEQEQIENVVLPDWLEEHQLDVATPADDYEFSPSCADWLEQFRELDSEESVDQTVEVGCYDE